MLSLGARGAAGVSDRRVRRIFTASEFLQPSKQSVCLVLDRSPGPPANGIVCGNGVLDGGCVRAKLPPSHVGSLMVSERIRRQIDRLLNDAEEALARFDWGSVRPRAEAVLQFDPKKSDALSLLAAANRGPGYHGGVQTPCNAPNPARPTDDTPTSFADSREARGRLGPDPPYRYGLRLGEDEGQPYPVTELMGGGDVVSVLQDAEGGKLPLQQAISRMRNLE